MFCCDFNGIDKRMPNQYFGANSMHRACPLPVVARGKMAAFAAAAHSGSHH